MLKFESRHQIIILSFALEYKPALQIYHSNKYRSFESSCMEYLILIGKDQILEGLILKDNWRVQMQNLQHLDWI